jgi:hypothetical protein
MPPSTPDGGSPSVIDPSRDLSPEMPGHARQGWTRGRPDARVPITSGPISRTGSRGIDRRSPLSVTGWSSARTPLAWGLVGEISMPRARATATKEKGTRRRIRGTVEARADGWCPAAGAWNEGRFSCISAPPTSAAHHTSTVRQTADAVAVPGARAQVQRDGTRGKPVPA